MTPERMRVLYEAHTDAEIGRLVGVSDVAVSNYRRKHGIATVTLRQRKDRERDGPTLDDLTPGKLASLYAQMGDKAISKLYGTSSLTIRRKRQAWGIQSLSKMDRATSTFELSDEQKEAVLGTLLGDAHMTPSGSLKVVHSYRQLGYLKHLQSILFPLAKPIFYRDGLIQGGDDTIFEFGFSTQQHVWLKTMRGVFYPQGPRLFPDSILTALMPRSLAFWYFDDGYLWRH